MHGLATGQESRQQLYTMLTRGRAANHLYLQVVGDGDPHTLIRPETVAPRTPTETLQQILARDDTPTSATTLLRELSDPAARLFDAVQRYTDGLHVAAEQLVGPQIVQMLDGRADQVVPELTSEPSWPTLRAHLLALAAETGEHPLLHLQTAAAGRELHTAGDMAAVLDWRLPEPAATDPGPLPWLPGIPQALHDHPVWGEYLAKRSQLVTDLADHVRDQAGQDGTQPVWAPAGSRRTSPSSVKSPCGGPPTASTPATHDQPDQHSCRQLPPSGNTTSTEVSPAAATTTSVILTSQSPRLPEPHVIAGTKIDNACPNHPRPARTRHPAPAYRSAPPGRRFEGTRSPQATLVAHVGVEKVQRWPGPEALVNRQPDLEFGFIDPWPSEGCHRRRRRASCSHPVPNRRRRQTVGLSRPDGDVHRRMDDRQPERLGRLHRRNAVLEQQAGSMERTPDNCAGW